MGRRRRSWPVVGLVVLLGALGTGLAAFTLHASVESWSRRVFEQKAEVLSQLVMAELVQYQVALADQAASIGAQPALSAGTFAAIAAPLNSARLPGATGISYVEATPGGGYAPRYARAFDGGQADAGRDWAGRPQAVAALERSRAEGRVATSATYASGPERGFVMAAAVKAGAEGPVRGWVVMSFLGPRFLGPAMGIIGGEAVTVEFADVSRDQPAVVAVWRSAAAPYDDIAARDIDLPFPEPDLWRLTVRPTVALLPATEAWLAPGAAAVGGLITVLLAVLTATVVTSRDRALRRVDEATAELRDDIERREAVEQQLRRREEELVGFAGVVAHDLRSPLTNVLGYASLMVSEDKGTLSEEQRGFLTRVQKSANRMQNLIDDLLSYAMADSALRLTEVDLNALVDSVVAERVGVGVAAAVAHDPLPTVLGDAGQVRQVLDNLIGNAIKYTPPGRTATIDITATTDAGLCRVEVADHGIGIPEHRRGDVFNAFTRVEGSERYPGTGLGLAIVQRIVEHHGGTVGVDANPGGGSRFWFTLPASSPVPDGRPRADRALTG